MTGFVARVAVACALFLATSSAPGFAMGLFNDHGSLHQRSAQDVHDTPEIDPAAAQGAVAIVIAGLILLADRRR